MTDVDGGQATGPAHARPGGRSGALPSARRHPLRTLLVASGTVVVGLVAWAVVWYEGQVDPGPQGPATIVVVARGSSVSAVTATLARQRVVHSSLAFRIYLVLHGTPIVRPGGYLLHRNEAFGAVRTHLARGPDVFPVTVLPGFTLSEVATRVGEVPGHDGPHFLALVTSGSVRSPYQATGSASLEGLLGTGTYLVVPGESDLALLNQMTARFESGASKVGLSNGAAALGVTPYQAVTIASIVQKEGVYRQNLGKVSRVIYNRLARGTPLQMDSTVLYSENRDGGPVTSADLALDTPYNTYRHTGLTPTAICFPSPASLRAALAPTPGGWLYFVVVSKDGTEAFSDTFAEQQANEALARSRGLG